MENRIRDCMTSQGFEYTPVDPFAQQQALTGKARISDEEFIEQFGYGISTLFGKGNQQSDPNERIRRSLWSADRAAYDRALWGDNPGVTFAEAVDSGDFSELGGCTKEASEAIFGGGPVLTSLVGRLDELDENIIQDQRMVRRTRSGPRAWPRRATATRTPDEIDERHRETLQGDRGRRRTTRRHPPPDPGTSYDRAALTELRAKRSGSPTPTWVREAGDHAGRTERASAVRGAFRKQNRGCWHGSNRSANSRRKFVARDSRLAATLAFELR